MPWYVITREPDEIEGRSSVMRTEAAALDFACGLIGAGVEVLRIEGDTELDGLEIAVHCADRRSRRRDHD